MNAKNQIVGNTYDAAGNLIIAQPGNFQYAYDAEHHLTTAGGLTYVYDGDGKRVEKASGSPLTANRIYWYGSGSQILQETDGAGNFQFAHFYFNGIHFGRQHSNNWIDHYGSDALGNVRYLYGYLGAWDVSDYYPFGGEWVIQSHSDNQFKLTGKERDPESGLDNFDFRYNSSSIGRFMSPDPENAGATLGSPQSWNAYSYVLNNPLKYLDPFGLACIYTNSTGDKVDRIAPSDCDDPNDEGFFVNNDPDHPVQTSDVTFSDNGNSILVTFQAEGDPRPQYSDFCVGDCSNYTVSAAAPAPTSAVGQANYDPFLPQPGPQFSYKPPETFGDKLRLAVGCAAGTPPDLVGGIDAGSGPLQDSTDTTRQTEGQKNVFGPGKNGKPRQYNPRGSGSAERINTASDRLRYVSDAFSCYGNGTTPQ
jgi:RHS repeat-associated protein